jgi:hypothetical protein
MWEASSQPTATMTVFLPRSPLRVRPENVIFCRHHRMALVPAFGVAPMGRKRVGRGVGAIAGFSITHNDNRKHAGRSLLRGDDKCSLTRTGVGRQYHAIGDAWTRCAGAAPSVGRRHGRIPSARDRARASPQAHYTHVYVAPENVDRFSDSVIATFGGTKSQQAALTVTPTPSKTMWEAVFTPVGTFAVFGFTTPIPYPFGLERTGYLVTDMDTAIQSARANEADVVVAPFKDPIGRDAVVSGRAAYICSCTGTRPRPISRNSTRSPKTGCMCHRVAPMRWCALWWDSRKGRSPPTTGTRPA